MGKTNWKKTAAILAAVFIAAQLLVLPTAAADELASTPSDSISQAEDETGGSLPDPGPSPAPPVPSIPEESLPASQAASLPASSGGDSSAISSSQPDPASSAPSSLPASSFGGADGSAPGEAAPPSTIPASSDEEAPASSETAASSLPEESEPGVVPMADYPPRDIKTLFGAGFSIVTGASYTFSHNGTAIHPDESGYYNLPAGTDAAFLFDFAIPSSVSSQLRANDYYDIALPNEFNITNTIAGPLIAPDQTHYADYSVLPASGSQPARVRITFTKDITGAPDLAGEVHFSATLDQGRITNPGEVTTGFPTEERLPPININIKPSGGANINKTGTFNQMVNPTSITWTIDVNTGLNNHIATHISDVLNSALGAPQNIEINYLNVNMSGEPVSVGTSIASGLVDTSYDPASRTFNAQFITALIHQAARITFVTPINADAIPAYGGNMLIPNTANFTSQSQSTPLPATATLDAQFSKPITKQLAGYDLRTQEFTWQVVYNPASNGSAGFQDFYNDNAPLNMEVKDPASGGVTAYAVSYDANGHVVVGAQLPDSQVAVAINSTGNDDRSASMGVTFQPALDTPVMVRYTTRVLNPADILADTPVHNHVVAYGNNGLPPGNGTGTAHQPWIGKSVQHTEGSNDYIWTVSINNGVDPATGDALTLPAGTVVTDTYDSRLEDVTSADVTVRTADGTVYSDGTEYDFVAGSKSFTLTFNVPITEQLLVTINSAVSGPAGEDNVVWNNANLQNGSIDVDTGAHYVPTGYENLTGGKEGEYNPVTKQITWRVWVNYSDLGLQNARIDDDIPAGQHFVPGSVRIYDYTVAGNQKVRGSQLSYTDPSTNVGLSVHEPSTLNNQTLTVRFPNVPRGQASTANPPPSRFWVEYETSLDGEMVLPTYHNEAVLHNDYCATFTLAADVSVARGGDLMRKYGSQGSDGYAWWTLEVNASQSTLANAVITDTLSTNQNFVPDSLQVQGARVDGSGALTPDPDDILTANTDYTVDYVRGATGHVVTIRILQPNPIAKPYIITFKAGIYVDNDNPGVPVSNQAQLDGYNQGNQTGGDNATVDVDISRGGGTIRGTLADFHLKKVDPSGTGLAGAEFRLFDRNGDPVGPPVTSDANGNFSFGTLITGRYTLKEVTPPPGYYIHEQLEKGMSITLVPNADGVRVYEIFNLPNGINLRKEDAEGNPLAGVEFILEKEEANGSWRRIRAGEAFVTDSNGWVYIQRLPVGQYRFVEVAAPEGYILNTEPRPFYVDSLQPNDQNDPILVGPHVNYQGQVKLTKTDPAERPLAGTRFALCRSTASGLTEIAQASTNANGTLEFLQLEPGDYALVEQASADGYQLDDTPIYFSVPTRYNGDFPVITLKMVNQPVGAFSASSGSGPGSSGPPRTYKGNLNIYKTDEDGNPLAGAVFRVFDENGHIVTDHATTHANGWLILAGLGPGKYTVQEYAAPEGYQLDTTAHAFEVQRAAPDQSTGQNSPTLRLRNHRLPGGTPPAGGAVPTGDNAGLLFPVILLCVAGTGLVAALVLKRRRKPV